MLDVHDVYEGLICQNMKQFIEEAFSKKNAKGKRPRRIIPVVAETFVINDNACAPPEGITELIDETNQLLPEGIKAGEKDLKEFILKRKRALAHGMVSVSTVSAAVVGAVPIPFPDAAILGPIELGEITAISAIFGLRTDKKADKFIDTIINTGTVSLVAKTAISAIRGIPGLSLVGAPLNAAMAGGIVATIGEGAVYAFEQVYLGKKSMDDLDWIKQLMESRLANTLGKIITDVAKKITRDSDPKAIAKAIIDALKKVK
ncbi:MAG: hypothetical protein K5696_01105 [Lachnospiraceae bacterium]|nr:hypothetical protein [Lachnospiraceae bacterium]